MRQARYVGLTTLFALGCMMMCAQNFKDKVLPNCPMHIIIALDFSASEYAFLDEVQTVLWALTSRFELHDNTLRIGVVSFNRGAQMILPLTGDGELVEKTIEKLLIPTRVFATDIHAGIQLANQEFEKNSVESVKKFLVIVSDGDPHAHSRGFGFREDLVNVEILKEGDLDNHRDPVHVFSLYSGEVHPFDDPFSEDIRQLSIKHMRNLASSEESFFFFNDYPKLINLLEQISSCL
jgi:hypothetical protein